MELWEQAEINALQIKMNQDLIDMVNNHEFYLAMHHCTIQGLMLSHDALDLENLEFLPCIPQFLEQEGYTSPGSKYRVPHLIPYIQPISRRDPKRNG